MATAFKPTPNVFSGRGNCVLEATWAVRNDLSPEEILSIYINTGKYNARTGGVYDCAWHEAFKALGIRSRLMHVMRVCTYPRTQKYPTLSQFVRKQPRGVLFVWTTAHAMALINGTVVDANYAKGGRPQERGRVRGALIITNPNVNSLL